jgi:hypothetical protein
MLYTNLAAHCRYTCSVRLVRLLCGPLGVVCSLATDGSTDSWMCAASAITARRPAVTYPRPRAFYSYSCLLLVSVPSYCSANTEILLHLRQLCHRLQSCTSFSKLCLFSNSLSFLRPQLLHMVQMLLLRPAQVLPAFRQCSSTFFPL